MVVDHARRDVYGDETHLWTLLRFAFAARHGGDVVACRIERGRDMPADKPGGAGHEGLHVYSKPIGWPSLTGTNYPPIPR